MKERQCLALVVGGVGAYLVAHAALAGYGLYLGWGVLGQPEGGPYAVEVRENYTTLAVLFAITAILGSSSIAAGLGFMRNFKWASWLWLITSVALVACIATAVISFAVAWTFYDVEIGAICLSWWLLMRMQRPTP